MIAMLKIAVKKMYIGFCYFITYLMLLSIMLTITHFIFNNVFKNFYISNYASINSFSLLIWGTITFFFVKSNYKLSKYLGHLGD